MPVYGDMLSVFPELIESHEVFKLRPRIGGGYGERFNIRTVQGYWSWYRDRRMEIEGDLRVVNHEATFWAKDDAITRKRVIEQNDMVEKNGDMYRAILDADSSRTGGFTRCLMQKMGGVTDRQVTNRGVDEAVINDY